MIVAAPALTAVTTPDASTVATAVLLLDHAPVPLPHSTTPLAVYVDVAPIHSVPFVVVTEVIAAFGLTVTLCDALTVPPQPPVIVYVIVAVPALTAVTTPDASTVATAVLLLDHAPVPLPPSTTPLAVYVDVAPIHSVPFVVVTEVIAAFGLTVTLCDALTVPPQPPVIVYVIVAVPALTAVTTPDASTVATAVLLLDHAPVPLPPSTTPLAVYVEVAPIQSVPFVVVTEVIAAFGFTIIAPLTADVTVPHVPVTIT